MSQSNKSDPKKSNSNDNKNKPVPVTEGLSSDTSEEVVSAVNQYFGIGRDPSTTTGFNKKTGNEHEDIVNKAPSEKNILRQSAPVSTREDSDLRKPETSKSSTSKPSQSQTIRSVRDQNAGRILTRSVSEKLFDQKQQGSGNVSLDPTESVVSVVTQYFGIGQDDKPAKKPTSVQNDQIVAVSQQMVDNHDTPNEAKKQTNSSKLPSTVTAKQKSSPETSTKGDNLSTERKSSPESIGKQSHPVVDTTSDDHKNVRRLTETREPSSKRVTIVPTVESTKGSERVAAGKVETSAPSTVGSTPSESVVSAVTDFFGISNSAPTSAPVSKTNIAPQQPITGARSNLKDPRKQDDTKVQSKNYPDPVGKVHPNSPGFGNEGETTRMIETSDIADSKETPTAAAAATTPYTPQKSPTPLLKKATDNKVPAPSATSAAYPEKVGAGIVKTPASSTVGSTPRESVVQSVSDTADSKETPTGAAVATKPSTPQKSPTPQLRKATDNKIPPPSATNAKEKVSAGKVETSASSTIGPTPSESVVSAVTDFFGISNSAPISAPVSKTNVAPQQPITSARSSFRDPLKQEDTKVAPQYPITSARSSFRDPLKQEDTKVSPKISLDTVRKAQPDSTAPSTKDETTRMTKTDQIISDTADSKETPTGAAVATKPSTPQKSPTPPVSNVTDKVPPLVTSSKGSERVAAGQVETPAPSTVGSTPSESVVTAVTDFFGISHSVQTSAAVSKMHVAPQQTTIPRKQSIDTRSNIKQDSLNVESNTNLDLDVQNVSRSAELKETPQGSSVAPIPVVVSSQDNKDKKKPYTSTAQQPEQKSEPVKPPLGFTSQTPQTQTTSTDGSKSPLMRKAPDSKLSPTSATSVKNIGVAADEAKTPKDIGQPDIVSATPVSAVGHPISSTDSGAQNTETPRTMDKAKQPIASGARSLSSPPAVHSTGSQGSKVPKVLQNVPTSNIEASRTSDDIKISGSTKAVPSSPPSQAAVDVIGSTGQSQPVVVASSGKLQPVGPSRTEAPRTLNEQTFPETVETTHNAPYSPPVTAKSISPVVVSAQDIGKSKGRSSNLPEDWVAREPSKAADLKAHSLPTDMKQHPQQTKTVPSSPPSQAAVVAGNITGQSQPIVVAPSEKTQPVSASMTETPRTLNERNVPESIETSSNVSPSSPVTVTNIPPMAVGAQGSSRNKGRSSTLSEDRAAQEPSKAAISKAQPVLAAASLQSQTVAVNSIETPRTLEGQRSLGITSSGSTKPAVPAGAEVNTIPVPVIVNAHDRRSNKVSNMNVPPSPIQSTAPSAGISNTGSAALTGIPSPNRGSYTSTGTARQCWICFATDEDELGMHWIQPCKCKGTTKWVHQSCLQMWVDEKLREHKEKKVACPQCRTEYLIYLPKANILVRSLDQVDNVIYRICPFIAAGVVIGSFYWNAVTYGAIVMLQVAGSEGAGVVTETFQPTVIIVGLPFIPLSLIVFRLFQWEDSFLYILRTTSHCIPPLQYLLPGHVVNETGVVTDAPETTAMSFQRVLAGALLTPVIAKICGNMFFHSVESPVWRTVFGGALFISVKGLIKMYHKQQTYKRLSRRKILDYTDENKRMIEMSRPVMISPVAPTPLRFQFVASVESRRTRRR